MFTVSQLSQCTSSRQQKNPAKPIIFGFRLIATDWLKKGSGFKTQSSKSCKIFCKNIACVNIYQLAKFHDQMIYNSRYIFRNILQLVC